MKNAISIVILVVLVVGGYFGYRHYQVAQAQRVVDARRQSDEMHAKAQQAANDAARKEIEAALKPMKVSSLLPGQPGMAIIDKTEYAEGDLITLPKGKQVKITKVRDDGIVLAYNGMTFHLDPPAAPDLAAIRKAH